MRKNKKIHYYALIGMNGICEPDIIATNLAKLPFYQLLEECKKEVNFKGFEGFDVGREVVMFLNKKGHFTESINPERVYL